MEETYPEAGDEIKIEVLGRLVPFQVVFERRSGKNFLLGGGSKPHEPEAAAVETVYPRVLLQRCWVHPARRDGTFRRRCGSATTKR